MANALLGSLFLKLFNFNVRFKVLRQLGKGAQGEVLKILDSNDNKE